MRTKTQQVDLGSKGSFSVKKGALHEMLGIPESQKIPASDLAPKPGDSPLLRRRKGIGQRFFRHEALMPDDYTQVDSAPNEAPQRALTPMPWPPENYEPGRYAPWYCGLTENGGTEEIYGPDELGEYANSLDELTQNVNKCDSAARIWEVLQSWEQRLFRRNYHFLNAGWKGWGMFGGSSGTSGASIMQTQNSMKLFSCNVFGTRHKKIVSLLGRSVPSMDIAPVEDDDPIDQAASEEAEKYLMVFEFQADLARCDQEGCGLLLHGLPYWIPDVHGCRSDAVGN